MKHLDFKSWILWTVQGASVPVVGYLGLLALSFGLTFVSDIEMTFSERSTLSWSSLVGLLILFVLGSIFEGGVTLILLLSNFNPSTLKGALRLVGCVAALISVAVVLF